MSRLKEVCCAAHLPACLLARPSANLLTLPPHHPVPPACLQDLQSLNADLLSGVLQVGKFIRLPPWNKASCPDPDSDAASCRVYTGGLEPS